MQQPHGHMQSEETPHTLYEGTVRHKNALKSLEAELPLHEGETGYYCIGTFVQDIRLLAGTRADDGQFNYLFETKSPWQDVYTGVISMRIPTSGPAHISRFDKDMAQGVLDSLYEHSSLPHAG